MNERCKKLISILNSKACWLTGKELASLLNVTDRTIRHDIDLINREFEGLIESNYRTGYRINGEVAKEVELDNTNTIPQTSDERVKYILNQLFRSKSGIDSYSLENQLFVSDSTVKADMRKLQKILEDYNTLQLTHDHNKYSLIGDEEEKRILFKKMLTHETQGDFINLQRIDTLFPQLDLMRVRDVLLEVFDEFDFTIREEALPMLMIHIGVSLQRMMISNFIHTFSKSEIKEVKEYQIAKTFYTRIKDVIYIDDINENECMLLASLLLGKRSANYNVNQDVVSMAKALTVKIVVAINEHYDIDFSSDMFFHNGLTIHLQNLIERLNHNIHLSNVYLAEVKKSYPLVFDLSVFIGKIIEDEVNKPISEDELGFLTIHLGAAYDRLNINNYFHAVLIQPDSNMMNSICLSRLKEKFSDRLIVDALIGYFDQTKIDQLMPDLLISTLPFECPNNIPVVNISMFVGAKDEFKIFKALTDLEKERMKNTFDSFIRKLIIDETFFDELDVDSCDQALNIMADNLISLGYVESSFKQSVFDREGRAFTSFVYGYAIPHALDFCAKKSCISIATLKKPIMWGDYPVKLVVMLAIKESEKSLLKIFFDWFGSVSDDETLMKLICNAKNRQEFIGYVLNND